MMMMMMMMMMLVTHQPSLHYRLRESE